MNQPTKISVLLESAREQLKAAGVPEAARQARDLLCLSSKMEAAFVIAHPEHEISSDGIARYSELVKRRANREPFQQIAGKQEFYGLEFKVTPDVMIPRPETELIVEAGIDILSKKESPAICEIGVGSGCIIISLLASRTDARGVGIDISDRAIRIASENAASHDVADRIRFQISDVYSSLGDSDRFDLIVSNPPYVPEKDVVSLQPEVRDFEPYVSLTDGADGLSILKRIIDGAPERLRPGGSLLLEMGFNQSGKVKAMFDPAVWASIDAFPDLQGIPRMIRASISVS